MSASDGTLSTRQLILDYGPTTRFGSGAIAMLPDILVDLRQTRAFLVTDPGLAASGIVGAVRDSLVAAGIETVVFDAVHPNPSTDTLDEGAAFLRAHGESAVVAVGGGSVLDTSKGIALMGANDGPARDFDYREGPAHPGFPVIAVPTTAGTGSETNSFGVIDDPQAHRKFYVGHASVLPRAVILDPDLTRGLPPGATAATGMDVLTHALESLSSPSSNPYSEGLNFQVVRMVSQFLSRAVADGQDLEARAQMLLAAHMAGLAFATTGLGLGHAVAHSLGARIDAAHGVALAVLLPHVLGFNVPVRTEAYAQVAWWLGVGNSHRDDRANAEAGIECVRRLAESIGMPARLGDLGCDESVIPAVVRDALGDEVIANTPRLPTQEELTRLLHAAL